MQLVAYGVQDVYLTGNPQITYWKVIYKRYTNFAVEPIEQSFSGTADFGKTSVTSLIARNGDLMTHTYLKATVSISRTAGTGGFAFVKRLGHAMIKTAELQIGGARIDLQYGDWMNIWWELSHEISQERGFAQMIGDIPYLTETSQAPQGADASLSTPTKTGVIFVPLTFWFCRNNGLALPLIALQYHDVRINFNFNPASELVVYEDPSSTKVTASITDSLLIIDYIFLDSEERKRFATSAHEYLIEQLQTPDEDTINQRSLKYRLPFNHPCKEVVWAVKLGKYSGGSFLSYNPYDNAAMYKRFAQVLYLACLNYNGSSLEPTESSSAGSMFAVTEPSNSAAAALLAVLQTTAVIITREAGTAWGPGNGFTLDGGLPTDFDVNPFQYVDFVDDSWMSALTPALLSTQVSDLGLTTSGTLYSYVSKWFVVVNQPFNYGLYLDGTVNTIAQGNLQLNGTDRFTVREGNYFNYVQPWQHHTNTPADGINVYSFALNPEEHQPSGTCNFSRIDFSQLNITLTSEAGAAVQANNSNSVIVIYTVNYNILRIMGKRAKSFALDFTIHTAHKSTQPVQSELLNWKNLLVALAA